jgi:hypothetical protein
MQRIPDVDRCVVPPAKLSAYLLNPEHEVGGPKGAFLELFGFDRTRPEIVETALLNHARRHDFDTHVATPHGLKYTVVARVGSPDGRNPWIRTVWITRTGEPPSFVTLIPVQREIE